MKLLYPHHRIRFILISSVKAALTIIFLLAACYSVAHAQSSQELVFKNGALKSGTAGADGAVYRFPSVMNNVDALVKINGRSSSNVKLVTIDLGGKGFDKAFQPQITYGDNNTSPAGNTDWWMEFQVSFVLTNTAALASISSFNISALDIDGNGDKISEYQSFYGLGTYTLEKSSQLVVSDVRETVAGNLTTVGKRFDGPVANYADVDTGATNVMTTNAYVNTNTFRMRAGAKSTGVSGAADRMYSLWFKGFNYQTAVTRTLPVTLVNWSAVYASNNVALKWTTTQEKNASHFIVERSNDGVEYTDAAMVFAAGNSDISINYSYNDKVKDGSSGIIYYRLKVVDMDGVYKFSDVKIVRIGKSSDEAKIITYPNPVVNDLRVTVPQSWQGKQVSYQLSNTSGQVIKSYTVQYASQTEIINMSQVPTGLYVVRAISGSETAIQRVVKSAK